ncbi:MAG TPA: anti-sigma factor [Thermoanaerobaculia bacterium]|nr:anti-sigma factor [Thermoanaerobaculia bacterium]
MTHADFESIAALDVLGVATAGEASALRAHLLGCIPCRRAHEEYADATTYIATSLDPVEPPRELRGRIAAALDSRTRFNPWWLAVAASLLFALFAWQSQRATIRRLTLEKAQLASQLALNARAIELTGKDVAPKASARVFLEPDRRRAIVFFQNLPANGKEKSYQLWIIRGDAPVSAGVFDVKEDGSAQLSIENLPVETEIKGLAVTLEPKGGVAQPTNTDFIVAGDV